MKRGMFVICLLTGMVFAAGLAGCKFTGATPDPNQIIEMRPGESKVFSVEGVLLPYIVSTDWYLNERYVDLSQYKMNLEFTVTPEVAKSNFVILECALTGYGYINPGRLDTRHWKIRILKDTAPPVYEGNYNIQDNTDIQYLNGYTTVTGNFTISDHIYNFHNNDVITNLSGLENLTTIGGDLRIWDNNALTSLSSLENLTSIDGNLDIYRNAALTSLSGLENLTSIGGWLRIGRNDALTSLGMTGLQRVDGDFEVTDNQQLCTSLAEELMNQVLAGGGIGGEMNIEGNKTCWMP
jgi:hypothetical protein